MHQDMLTILKKPHEKYFEYLLEREGLQLVECGPAIGLYKHMPEGLIYLHTVYVPSEYRKQGWGRSLMLFVLKNSEAGVTTSVCPATEGASESLAACLSSGFKVTSTDSNLIYLFKPKEEF